MVEETIRAIFSWLTFILWCIEIIIKPWLETVICTLRIFLVRMRVLLIKLIYGSSYPLYLLDERIVKVFGSNKRPTIVQILGMPKVLKGENVLLVAPTGSGKTEAALLPILSALAKENISKYGVYVLYITPLRALCSDIAKRINNYVSKVFGPFYYVAAWHSDISEPHRKRLEGHPPLVLVTTPESLEVILDTREEMCWHLRNLKAVIIDEAHELVGTKRGHQLTILLERLKTSLGIKRLQRVLISATVADLKRIAKFFEGSDGKIIVVRDPTLRKYEINLKLCGDDVTAALNDVITSKGYLVFVNTRAEAEYLHKELESAGIQNIRVHHSSMSREQRKKVEDDFKRGKVWGVVCTRTLELGIDVGFVNIVAQISSPGLPEYLAQRLGRSAHRPKEPAKGYILCRDILDFFETLALINMMQRGSYCGERHAETYLDVIARETVAIALQKEVNRLETSKNFKTLSDIYNVFTQTYPYKKLSQARFNDIIRILVKRKLITISNEGIRLGEGFEKVWYGKTYPKFFVFLPEKYYLDIKCGNSNIGHIDPVNLRFLRRSVYIRLGGKCWKIKHIDTANWIIYVEELPESSGIIPVWRGGGVLTPQSVAIEFYRILSKTLKSYKSGKKGVALSINTKRILLKPCQKTIKALNIFLGELVVSNIILPKPWKIIVEEFYIKGQLTLVNFLHKYGEHLAKAGITALLYPFGDYISNTLTAALWSTNKVRRVIPRPYGILIYHDPGFDPLKYLLKFDEIKLKEQIKDTPYIILAAFEARRSFEYKSTAEALKKCKILRKECEKQVANKYFDIKTTAKLLEWIKNGCIRIHRTQPTTFEEAHPLTKILFNLAPVFRS